MQIPAFDSYKRTEISPTALAVLVDIAAADPSRPLHAADVNWDEVLVGLGRHALIGLAFHYLACNPGSIVPSAFRDAVKKAHSLAALRMAIIHRNLFQLLEQLNASGLDYLVVKGPAVAFAVYPDPSLRVFNDLDLVVRECDWQRAHALLTGLGFQQEEDLPAPPSKLHPKMVCYETTYIHSASGFKVEIHYDDLLNAGLAARDVEGFWQRANWMEARGVSFKVLSAEDQLMHLCAHAHYHSYTRLNWFSDLALLLRGPNLVQWDRLLEVVRAEDAAVPVYYSLYFLQQLLGVPVPADVLQILRPPVLIGWLHERYMPAEKILSMQPMHRYDFSFYFIPFFQRLLPTLLVMGRRRENLAALARLVFPPRDWLCAYYDIKKPAAVPLNYLIHPPRLLLVYLREAFRVFSYWLRGEHYEYINKKTAPAE